MGQSLENPSTARANARALDAFNRTTARLAGIAPASSVVPQVGPRHYLHAGPPIEGAPSPCIRAALVAALLYEREVRSASEAAEIVDRGELELTPCHEVNGVGAMAGVVSPNVPVAVVESGGDHYFSPLNEGPLRALRFGCYDDDTLERLRSLTNDVVPLLDRSIKSTNPIDLTAIMEEALRRGDECHNRTVAAGTLLLLALAPAIARAARKLEDSVSVLDGLTANPHFFGPFSLASSKGIAEAAHGIAGCSVVTAIASNGTSIGIRVSGLHDKWFVGDAPTGNVEPLANRRREDAHPFVGDSAITETIGLGALALTSAPAISRYIGSTTETAAKVVARMRRITAGTSERFLLPYEGFRGTPLGIDVHRVAAAGIPPEINHGVVHLKANEGQVGAGLSPLPMTPFLAARDAMLTVLEAQSNARL